MTNLFDDFDLDIQKSVVEMPMSANNDQSGFFECFL